MRLIDADKTLDEILRADIAGLNSQEVKKKLKDILIAQPEVREPTVGEWIPCEERLPEEGKIVLLTIDIPDGSSKRRKKSCALGKA